MRKLTLMPVLPLARAASPPRERLPTSFVINAAVGAGLLLVVGIYVTLGGHESAAAVAVASVSSLGFTLYGGLACVRAARQKTSHSRAWGFLSLSFLLWTIGSAITISYAVTGDGVIPYPSLADAAFLAYGVPVLVALYFLPKPEAPPISRWRAAADAAVIAVGLTFLSFATVLDPAFRAYGVDSLKGLVLIAYPVSDLVICSVVLTLGMRQPRGERLAWWLLGGGLIVLAVTDSVFSRATALGQELTGPMLTGWMAAGFLVALATLVPPRKGRVSPNGLSNLVLEFIPYLPVVAGGAVLLGMRDLQLHRYLLALGALLLVCLVARQAMIVLENLALTGNLEHKVAELHSLSAIVTSSHEAIVGVALDGRITSVNHAAERLFGYSADSVVGQIPTFMSSDRQQALRQIIETAELKQDVPGYETEWPRPDGSKVQIALSFSPILHGTSFQGISVSAQDISERKLVAASLESARVEALEASRLKSNFLATMSHEIRTPMNGVIGLSGLLLETRLDEVQRQYAEGVHAAGDALLTVINDILDFSKLEAGKVDLEVVDLDIRVVVDEAATLLAPLAHEKRLELLAYCLPDVPDTLRGDPGRIRQILLNLASNAVKFTSTGEVAIRVSSSATEQGVLLRIEVKDTGIGISPNGRDRLFTSFSQADASTTRRYGGTGLGLAISSQLVTAMEGRIGLDSEIGQGSTFWCELPLPLGHATPAQRPAPPDGLLAGMRVLVVDDNATNRQILHSQLTAWRLQPDLAEDAQAAQVRLRSSAAGGQPYDIVVLDMCMPDMDGLELARIISADPELHGTAMIMLTSTHHLEPRDLTDAGIGEWLTKPVRSSELYDRLMRLMTPSADTNRPGTGKRAEISRPRVRSLGRVLIVEDNALNQLVAEAVVSRLGYQVNIVANGAQALEALQSTSYSAVLMDCHMPVMDGFEATENIRRRKDTNSTIPIIAMTAGAMPEDRARCLEAGMDDYVSKPVDINAIEAVLQRWIVPTDVPAEPPIDEQRLTDLRQLSSLSDRNLMAEVINLFTSEAPATLAALHEAVETGPLDDIVPAAHKLRGTCGEVGATRVAGLCLELETGAHTLSPTERGGVLTELDTELDLAMLALQQALLPTP
jgi:two-component system sensor histidine kinase/response regulator